MVMAADINCKYNCLHNKVSLWNLKIDELNSKLLEDKLKEDAARILNCEELSEK